EGCWGGEGGRGEGRGGGVGGALVGGSAHVPPGVPSVTHSPKLPAASVPLNSTSLLKTVRSAGSTPPVAAPLKPVSSDVPPGVPSVTHRPSLPAVLMPSNSAIWCAIRSSLIRAQDL